MRLAIQETLVSGKTLLEKLRKLEKYGFEGIEIWGSDIIQRVGEIKSALSSSKIRFSTVCSGYSGDLLGPDRESRELAVEGIKERLKVCAGLGGVGVITVPTFGGPKIPRLPPRHSEVYKIEKEILVEECEVLGKYADDVGAHVILEPLNRYETHFIKRLEQAAEICSAVGREHIKIMGDFFHMNIEERDIPSSLEKASDFLIHINPADSNRKLPGYSHINFKDAFNALKKKGYEKYMALECRVPGPPDVELPRCVKYLKRFI